MHFCGLWLLQSLQYVAQCNAKIHVPKRSIWRDVIGNKYSRDQALFDYAAKEDCCGVEFFVGVLREKSIFFK